MAMNSEGENNEVVLGKNIRLEGHITGCNNKIIIGNSRRESQLEIKVTGNNNTIIIEEIFQAKKLQIHIGNHVPANKVQVKIGRFFSVEGNSRFLLPNSGSSLTIGDSCMLSNNITVRLGDSPHLIFDSLTGEYLDVSANVTIGDHVWVGENVYMTKRAAVASESIVAACSVVTKAFDDMNVVIAGNPAKVARRNVQWVRNRDFLEAESAFHTSFHTHMDSF